MLEFHKKHGRLPKTHDRVDEQVFYQDALRVNDSTAAKDGAFSIPQVNEQLAKSLSSIARCQIAPLCIYWGAVVAKEVVSFIGKYYPVFQF
jgi:hypothetical protein